MDFYEKSISSFFFELYPSTKTAITQLHQSQSEEEKASLRKLSTKLIKTILREFRQDREATEKKYNNMKADYAVPVLTEELRIRGVPEHLIPIP